MHIGPLKLTGPGILAPLAGYTDLAFRLLCRREGAAMCFSEMISCHGLVYGQKKTLELLASDPAERPVAFQLFGNEPGIMGEAADLLNPHPMDALDINMGCPVRKVIRKGSGSALMKDFDRASAIIQAVCRNSRHPVTVKFRSGWNSGQVVAPEFARMAEESGAAAVTIHARSWAQGFGGKADWEVIARVKDAVSVPVIGNGDILSHGDGIRMMAQTGCDAFMVGRGSLGNPWVFQEQGRPATLSGRRGVILAHLELMERYIPPRKLLFKAKNHISRYLSGLPGATRIRGNIMAATTMDEIRSALPPSSLYP